MALRAEFQAVPVEVFNEMDDVVLGLLLRQYANTYVAGGTVTQIETDYAVRIVEDAVTDTELAIGSVQNGDRKFLTPAAELPIRPKPKDAIVEVDDIWNIYRVAIDPAGALWTLYARQ